MTINTHGLRTPTASILVVLFLTYPLMLGAQERRGASLVVTTKESAQVSGELIAVKPNALLMLSPVGKDESVDVSSISSVTITKRSKAGTGFLLGFLVGGIAGGALGSKLNEGDSPDERGRAAFFGVLLFGSLAGLVGLGIGAAAGSDETIVFEGSSETEIRKALNRLRGMARLRNVE